MIRKPSSFVIVRRVYRGGRVPGKRVRHNNENFYRSKILEGNTLFLINIKKHIQITFCNSGRRRALRIHYVLLLRVHVSYVYQQNYTYILIFNAHISFGVNSHILLFVYQKIKIFVLNSVVLMKMKSFVKCM